MIPILIRRRLRGANGRNWPGLVILDPGAPLPAAVAAQELWEAGWKLNPVNLFRRFLPSQRRVMEIIGHEVEVQAAVLIYDVSEAVYRRAEAVRMARGYDGLFRDQTPGQIAAAMERRSARAARWVQARRTRLERLK